MTSVIIACLNQGLLQAQGCVAVRGFSSCSGQMGNSATISKGELLAQTGFRYFQSFRHFRGIVEEFNRVEEGTQVVNNSYFLDFSLLYAVSDRLYVNANIPLVFHNRSSMYEHGGNPPNGLGERHETSSHGLADIRLVLPALNTGI